MGENVFSFLLLVFSKVPDVFNPLSFIPILLPARQLPSLGSLVVWPV